MRSLFRLTLMCLLVGLIIVFSFGSSRNIFDLLGFRIGVDCVGVADCIADRSVDLLGHSFFTKGVGLSVCYWKNSIIYWFTNGLTVSPTRNIAVFSMGGNLLYKSPISSSSSNSLYNKEFKLTDPLLVSQPFPMTFSKLCQSFGPPVTDGSGALNWVYLLSNGCTVNITGTVSQSNPLDINPDHTMVNLVGVWSPYTLAYDSPDTYEYSDPYYKERPTSYPNTQWMCNGLEYQGYYQVGPKNSGFGKGYLIVNGHPLAFTLITSIHNGREVSFVPLDSQGMPTHWAFTGICKQTDEGFDFISTDTNGFLDYQSINLSFKIIS